MDNNLIETVIMPAIDNIFASDCDYRCERDLHHHLTSLFGDFIDLKIGSFDRIIEYEHPTEEKYRWVSDDGRKKAGQIDLFFFDQHGDSSLSVEPDTQSGIAIECNFDYDDSVKIKQDVIKLIDPGNKRSSSVYIAVGKRLGFQQAIQASAPDALAYFSPEAQSSFPMSFVAMVVEHFGVSKRLWKGCPTGDGQTLEWSCLKTSELTAPSTGQPWLTKDDARSILRTEMAGIPLTSITARCMFERTISSKGVNECAFGRTPLWDNLLHLDDGKALRSEFLDLVRRLVESGNRRQGR